MFSIYVVGLATELWSFLTFSRGRKYENDGNLLTEYQQAPLSTQSLLLLLVLVNHCTRQEHQNPYRLVLFSCGNSVDKELIPPSTRLSVIFKIDYDGLLGTLCKRANGECATLLLYLLIHRNATFRTYLLNSNKLDSLVSSKRPYFSKWSI